VSDDQEHRRQLEEEQQRRAEAEERARREREQAEAFREAQKALLGGDDKPQYPDDPDDA
jgi:hypothetical protein